ncbi:MAG TPA: hypothetical protein VLH77_06715 [Gammaproteobacteria bacterium]|nr:hypothetical protein [Gammaproteobacteria bacterium]
MKILTESTPLALWYGAVQKAQTDCHIALKADVESYLVFMLMRYANNPRLAREVMAFQFLDGINSPLHQRGLILQNVGDQCLLITGLFPAVAEKRRVKIRYYIELGKISYEVISRKNNDIFSLLSQQFLLLTDVLQTFRPYHAARFSAQLYQLWEPPTDKK